MSPQSNVTHASGRSMRKLCRTQIYPQVRHVHGDALELEIEAALSLAQPSNSERGAAVVANIPYNITTPLIARFLEHRPQFRTIVLLVQKEVGERMAAIPASDAYGAFSLFVQFHAEIEIVASVPPDCFLPAAQGDERDYPPSAKDHTSSTS